MEEKVSVNSSLICLENELKSFCRFWDCIQVQWFGLLLTVKVAQSCLTLCDPMDYTVQGILHARILECIAVPFSIGSSHPRDWTQDSRFVGGFFTTWATREALLTLRATPFLLMDCHL